MSDKSENTMKTAGGEVDATDEARKLIEDLRKPQLQLSITEQKLIELRRSIGSRSENDDPAARDREMALLVKLEEEAKARQALEDELASLRAAPKDASPSAKQPDPTPAQTSEPADTRENAPRITGFTKDVTDAEVQREFLNLRRQLEAARNAQKGFRGRTAYEIPAEHSTAVNDATLMSFGGDTSMASM